MDSNHETLLRHYVELEPSERIAVHDLQTKMSQQLGDKFDRAFRAAFYYATLILTVRHYNALRTRKILNSRMTQKQSEQRDRLPKTTSLSYKSPSSDADE